MQNPTIKLIVKSFVPVGRMTETEHHVNLRFFEVLREHSDDKHDPIPEWEFKGFITRGTKEKCICGTPIELNYLIEHKRTQKQLIIGSECVKRWIQPKLECEECGNPLGRVMERTRKKDFLCRSCKKILANLEAQKQREREIEAEKERKKIERMGKLRLFWWGKYHERMFSEVAEDIPYVEYLLSIPEEKATKSIRAFWEYAELVFDVKEADDLPTEELYIPALHHLIEHDAPLDKKNIEKAVRFFT